MIVILPGQNYTPMASEAGFIGRISAPDLLKLMYRSQATALISVVFINIIGGPASTVIVPLPKPQLVRLNLHPAAKATVRR